MVRGWCSQIWTRYNQNQKENSKWQTIQFLKAASLRRRRRPKRNAHQRKPPQRKPQRRRLRKRNSELEVQAILLFKTATVTSPLFIFRGLQFWPAPPRVCIDVYCDSPIFCKSSTTRASLRRSSRRGSILSSATGI